MLRVAVDFGTSNTCTAVSVDGRTPQVVVVDGAPLMPSAVYVAQDGTLFVGHEADRQAALDPARYEPHPKRRIDEAELLLGNTVLPVTGVVRAVLRRALLEARHIAGGAPVDQLVLTHPAGWGAARTQRLRRSAHGLAPEVVLVPEPVAAAVFHARGHAVPDGGCLAVLDLGGGTVDASVVRRAGVGFVVPATCGDANFGGADVDQALLEHVGAQVSAPDPQVWRRMVEGRELADRRRRRVLRQDVRGAKETLSRHTYADVPMPPPFPDAHVTRDDLERLIAASLRRTVALLQETIATAGLRPEQLVAIFLVGGSSRIPMVSRLLHERFGLLPVTLDQPETVVARGALQATIPAPPAMPAVPAVPAVPVVPTPSFRPVAAGQPTLPRRASGRRSLWIAAGAVLAMVGAAALTLALTRDEAPEGQQVADFHYRFTVPAGWQRGGGSPAERQVELAPADASTGTDRIFVRELELGYDAGADRNRAIDELRADYETDRAATSPPPFDGFDPDATFAGRDVLYYAEHVTAGTVDWYVLFGGRYQVSIGCRHDEAGAERVRTACEQVVRTAMVVP